MIIKTMMMMMMNDADDDIDNLNNSWQGVGWEKEGREMVWPLSLGDVVDVTEKKIMERK